MCSLQQGYECTRRFLAEFISSPSSDTDVPLTNDCDSRSNAAGSQLAAPNSERSLCDLNVMELSSGLNNSMRTSSADEDVVPWCTASQQLCVSHVLDSSFSDASVFETPV